MALTSYIDNFPFVSLSRLESPSSPPPSPHETLIPIQRHGVEGTAFILCGEKGQPFYMRGVQTTDSLNDAEQLEANYKTLIGAGKYVITWGGDVINTHKYVVMDVTVIRVQRSQVTSDGSGAVCESIWTLVAVSNA